MAVQCLFVGINIAFAQAAHVEAPVSAWFFAWTTAKIIAIAPVSLGGLGVREASMAGLLKPFGADPASHCDWFDLAVGPLCERRDRFSGPAASSCAGKNGIGAKLMEQVVVLGARQAGVGAGLMLAQSGKASVKVLERAAGGRKLGQFRP